MLSDGGITVLEIHLCKLAGSCSCLTKSFLAPGSAQLVLTIVSRESDVECYSTEENSQVCKCN